VRKQEWIITSAAIVSSATLFVIGLFLLHWATWNYLSGYGSRPSGLGYIVMFFGGSFIVGGIISVWKFFGFLSQLKNRSAQRQPNHINGQ